MLRSLRFPVWARAAPERGMVTRAKRRRRRERRRWSPLLLVPGATSCPSAALPAAQREAKTGAPHSANKARGTSVVSRRRRRAATTVPSHAFATFGGQPRGVRVARHASQRPLLQVRLYKLRCCSVSRAQFLASVCELCVGRTEEAAPKGIPEFRLAEALPSFVLGGKLELRFSLYRHLERVAP